MIRKQKPREDYRGRFCGELNKYTEGERSNEWLNFKDYLPSYTLRYIEYLRLQKDGLY